MNKPEARRHWRQQRRLAMATLGPTLVEQVRACPVSYTHLTLPTIVRG